MISTSSWMKNHNKAFQFDIMLTTVNAVLDALRPIHIRFFFCQHVGEQGLTNIIYLKFPMTDQVEAEKCEDITTSFTLF